MSHITIIISKLAPEQDSEVTYEYCMPVPHGTTPKKVGEMVRNAYQHLEGHLVGAAGANESERID